MGEYCRYINHVALEAEGLAQYMSFCKCDILLRSGRLNMFLAIRSADSTTVVRLFDKSNREAPEDVYATNEDIAALEHVLSTFEITSAVPVLPDQASRITLGREEDVGSDCDNEPLLLTSTDEAVDCVVRELRGARFYAS